jgi:Streptomycin adenylyltransferase
VAERLWPHHGALALKTAIDRHGRMITRLVLFDELLQTVVEWFIGLQHDWSTNTGVRGRKFKRYPDEKTWSEYTSTFAGAGIEANWQAFFNAVALFGRLARIVGDHLGYEYPAQLERKMVDYYTYIRNHKKGNGEQSAAGDTDKLRD